MLDNQSSSTDTSRQISPDLEPYLTLAEAAGRLNCGISSFSAL